MNIKPTAATLSIFPFFYLAIIHAVMFDFERSVEIGDTKEVVRGSIYYEPQGRTIVEVTHPILQYMIFSDKQWTVYYPDKETAYTIHGNQPFQIPFVDILQASLKEDFGLMNDGFQLQKHEVYKDTIVTFWGAGGSFNNIQLKLMQVKEKYVSFEMLEGDSVRIRSTFKAHDQIGDKFFPIEVFSEIFPGWGGYRQMITETLYVRNQQINRPFPERITGFEIPAEIEVKTLDK